MTGSSSNAVSWSSYLAILTSLCILIGIAYDWSYFFIIDINLVYLLSINDYISSTVRWAPQLFILLFVGAALRAIQIFWYLSIHPEQPSGEQFDWDFPKKKKILYACIIILCLVAMVVMGLKLPKQLYYIIFAPFMLFWYCAKELILSDRKFFEKSFFATVAGIEYGPLILAFAASYGAYDGASVLNANTAKLRVFTANSQAESLVRVRYTDKFIIGLELQTNEVRVLDWSEVVSIGLPSAGRTLAK